MGKELEGKVKEINKEKETEGEVKEQKRLEKMRG